MDNEKKQDIRYSLSDINEEPEQYGNLNISLNKFKKSNDPYTEFGRGYGIYGNDIILQKEDAPVPKKETPPKEKSAKEKKIEELNSLYRLLQEKDRQFEKAKGKRAIKTIFAFTVVYFIIFCTIKTPSSIADFAGALLGAVFFAGLHFWANALIFGQLFEISQGEKNALEEIRKRIREVENGDTH